MKNHQGLCDLLHTNIEGKENKEQSWTSRKLLEWSTVTFETPALPDNIHWLAIPSGSSIRQNDPFLLFERLTK